MKASHPPLDDQELRMFGFSMADWIFCIFILVVIAACVAISAMIQKKKTSKKH
jgi:disulfide bond formation protein DsbB